MLIMRTDQNPGSIAQAVPRDRLIALYLYEEKKEKEINESSVHLKNLK